MKPRGFSVVNAMLAAWLIAGTAHAADAGPPGAPPGPPPEAVAACAGKSAGVQVSFTGRRGETVSGTCELVNGVLAARPAGAPPGGPGGPPPVN
ncbi:MAG: hypothetical protein JWP29_1641 [Rhodoferax sp.]|nr:hypothetical protein [Rhodoferax sp.]